MAQIGLKAHPSVPEDYLLIDYELETNLDPKLTLASLCSEQSTAQWVRPGKQEDLRGKFGAKCVAYEVSGESNKPLYAWPWVAGNKFIRLKARIAHPLINFGPHIPNLLSAVAGEGAFYCPGVTCLRITNLHFPSSFLKLFEGPQFGLSGIREKLKVFDRPIFVGVVKPNIGLDSQDFSDTAYASFLGGLDIAKDDEMLANPPASSFEERIKKSALAARKAERITGKNKMYLANITDEIDEMMGLVQKATLLGADMVMVNAFFTGMSGLRHVRRHCKLPIMSHFTGMALYDRVLFFGMDGVVTTKLQRLLGADIIGLPGFGERMQTTDEQVLKNMEACLESMGNIKPSLPIPGGSDWAGTLPKLFEKIGHTDFGFIAGRGVFNHPDGPEGGAKSLNEAWEAISQKISLEKYAETHPALGKALKMFG
ncbi:MAG: hypothetical protein A2048_08370 [Deltaproteobacteria bacterium GWA2_45_12]|nr:MAG: hypothetical protein A2048_08370 [Deltaproteobacteria bacterium GWA2_45_12]